MTLSSLFTGLAERSCEAEARRRAIIGNIQNEELRAKLASYCERLSEQAKAYVAAMVERRRATSAAEVAAAAAIDDAIPRTLFGPLPDKSQYKTAVQLLSLKQVKQLEERDSKARRQEPKGKKRKGAPARPAQAPKKRQQASPAVTSTKRRRQEPRVDPFVNIRRWLLGDKYTAEDTELVIRFVQHYKDKVHRHYRKDESLPGAHETARKLLDSKAGQRFLRFFEAADGKVTKEQARTW